MMLCRRGGHAIGGYSCQLDPPEAAAAGAMPEAELHAPQRVDAGGSFSSPTGRSS